MNNQYSTLVVRFYSFINGRIVKGESNFVSVHESIDDDDILPYMDQPFHVIVRFQSCFYVSIEALIVFM